MTIRCLGLVVVLASLPQALARGEEPRTDRYGDPLPTGAIARIGTVRLRNAGDISDVALSPDGTLIVTASRPSLCVWDARTGALVRAISKPKDDRASDPARPVRSQDVAAMAFASDSSRLHVLTQGGNLRVCNVQDGTWGKTLSLSEAQDEKWWPTVGSASPDGTHFFFKPHNDKWKGIEVFAVSNDKPLRRITEPNIPEYGESLSVCSNNKLFAVVLKDGTARVWNLKTGDVVANFRAPDGVFYSVAVSPDGTSLIGTCGAKNPYALSVPPPAGAYLFGWDLETGKERFRVPDWEGRFVTYAPAGNRFISFAGGDVVVGDAATGKVVHRLRGHGARWVMGYSFRADGKQLVTSGRDHTAILWDVANGKKVLDFDSPRGSVDVLAFAPDGKTLFAACADDHTGGLWDADTGKLRHWLVSDNKGNPLTAAFTPDGRGVVVGYGVSRATSTGKEWTARLWGTGDGKVVRAFGGHTDGVHQLAVSSDGKRLATRDWGSKVRLWELGSGKLTRELDWAPYDRPVGFGFTPTGDLIGASMIGGSTDVIDLLSGKKLGGYKSNTGAEFLAVSPDGQLLAASERRGRASVTIGKVTSGEAVVTLSDADWGSGLVAAFSPDGKTVAVTEGMKGGVAHADVVHLYDLKTGKQVRTHKGHKGAIAVIAFSPDGKRLATGSWDSSAIVWDLTAQP